MGQVHVLPTTPKAGDSTFEASSAVVRPIGSARCSLCGAQLSARALRYRVVSPQCCDTPITVCHTCRQAAIGEGYRPAE